MRALNLSRDLGSVLLLAPDRAAKTKDGVVRLVERLGLGVVRDHGQDRPELLLVLCSRFRRASAEDGKGAAALTTIRMPDIGQLERTVGGMK